MLDKDQILDRKTFTKGSFLMREGEEGQVAFLLQSGKVRVFKNDGDSEFDLTELGAGSIIGEVALILDETRTASVQAIEDCIVIVINRQDFDRKLQRADDTLRAILRLLSQRLQAQNEGTMEKLKQLEDMDEDTLAMTKRFAADIPEERKMAFMEHVMPHINRLVKAMKSFKS